MQLPPGHFRPVIVSSYEQLLERWNKVFALKQEFRNRPECPTKSGNNIA
jgi:hypothetical protein